MPLTLIRHLWGVAEALTTFIPKARQRGYAGIEGSFAWTPPAGRAELTGLCQEHGLLLVPQIFTGCDTGGDQSVEAHLASFRRLCADAVALGPAFINAHSGLDAWSTGESVRFYREAQRIEADLPVVVSHETHRGRTFYNPWTTREVLGQVGGLHLTADFSHWTVVAGDLLEEEADCIALVAAHCHHIHARVGHGNGPQVSDPRAPEWAGELAAHEGWWDQCFAAMAAKGRATLTPEFGPPGYQPTLPYTQQPVSDLNAICDWMAQRQAQRYGERFPD